LAGSYAASRLAAAFSAFSPFHAHLTPALCRCRVLPHWHGSAIISAILSAPPPLLVPLPCYRVVARRCVAHCVPYPHLTAFTGSSRAYFLLRCRRLIALCATPPLPVTPQPRYMTPTALFWRDARLFAGGERDIPNRSDSMTRFAVEHICRTHVAVRCPPPTVATAVQYQRRSAVVRTTWVLAPTPILLTPPRLRNVPAVPAYRTAYVSSLTRHSSSCYPMAFRALPVPSWLCFDMALLDHLPPAAAGIPISYTRRVDSSNAEADRAGD